MSAAAQIASRKRVEKAAAAMAAAQAELEDAVREARQTQLSLRLIAKDANMSHEQVRRLTH